MICNRIGTALSLQPGSRNTFDPPKAAHGHRAAPPAAVRERSSQYLVKQHGLTSPPSHPLHPIPCRCTNPLIAPQIPQDKHSPSHRHHLTAPNTVPQGIFNSPMQGCCRCWDTWHSEGSPEGAQHGDLHCSTMCCCLLLS